MHPPATETATEVTAVAATGKAGPTMITAATSEGVGRLATMRLVLGKIALDRPAIHRLQHTQAPRLVTAVVKWLLWYSAGKEGRQRIHYDAHLAVCLLDGVVCVPCILKLDKTKAL